MPRWHWSIRRSANSAAEARASPAQGFVCADCRALARFIEPPFCERCGRPYAGDLTGPFECADCLEAGWAFRTARSAVVARDSVLEVIHRYKYGRALWLEPFLAGLLISRAAPLLAAESWHALVPVPLHPTRQRQREFNQAERLADRLSQATRIPVNRRLLRRVAPTRTQTQLSRRERLANVRTAFAMRPGDPCGRPAPGPHRRRHDHRRHHRRLRRGSAGCRGRRSLRLDSCPRNLNTILRRLK